MGKELRKERTYAYPPEVVWVALTDPRALAEWLMPNTFKAEVGHRFQFRTDPVRSCEACNDCEVLELDPPRRMVWSWRIVDRRPGRQWPPMRITWELERAGANETKLIFTQSGLEGQKWMWMMMMRFGWGYMFKRLLPKVLANCGADGSFTPGGIPLEKRCYKTKTLPAEFVR